MREVQHLLSSGNLEQSPVAAREVLIRLKPKVQISEKELETNVDVGAHKQKFSILFPILTVHRKSVCEATEYTNKSKKSSEFKTR